MTETDKTIRAEGPVLLLGDSVTTRISRYDTDLRTLDRFVEAGLPEGHQVWRMAGTGYHMGVFCQLVHQILEAGMKPSAIILPINMRSFSPQWYLDPRWQHDGTPGPCSNEAELKAVPVAYPLSSMTTFGEFLDAIQANPTSETERRGRLRDLFVFHYTHPLVHGHQRLNQLSQLLAMARDKAVPVVAYMSPINHQALMEHVGDPGLSAFRANVMVARKVVDAYLDTGGVVVLDLSEMLDRNCFFHIDEGTEHLTQLGRAALGAALADATRHLLSLKESGSVSQS